MKNREYLSLWDAVLINLNVMFGTGVLINTVTIAQKVGFLGFFSYLSVALLMLPLIYSMMLIVKKYPTGGFYQYAANDLGEWAGFLSSWIYFIAKLASATLLVHVFSGTFMNLIGYAYSASHIFFLDALIFLLFLWLNHFNLKTGTKITYVFIGLKFTPVLFMILSGLYLYKGWIFPTDKLLWSQVPSTMSFILYAFVGFEAACSLSGAIINSERNAPRAILYSYGIVVLVSTLYQFIVFLALGSSLSGQNSFLCIFSQMFKKLFLNELIWQHYALDMFYLAIACSALGGSYGILLSNAWNLHTLAKKGHTFIASSLSKLNSYGVPFFCIMVEVLVCATYLLLTQGNFIVLQQISVLGCTIAYAMSVIALLISSSRTMLAIGALISCIILLSTCLQNLVAFDARYILFFLMILLTGFIMFLLTTGKKVRNNTF